MSKKGVTLVELMVVVGLVAVLFSVLISLMINADVYWRRGMNKIDQHQEARRVMNTIIRPMKDASPFWSFNCTAVSANCSNWTEHHGIITNANSRIKFYKPVFFDNGTFDKDSDPTEYIFRFFQDNRTLQVSVDGADPVTISSGVLNMTSFSGSECVDSPVNTTGCRSITVSLMADNDDSAVAPFPLTSQVTAMNEIRVPVASNASAVNESFEEPAEGEF
ncbi:MAG: type II secretion system protein [Candidatus Omnitrophota bacterium]